ncbi:MAG: hypothetical protein L3K19_04950 [Thermoplasmata archaeon]|nr:hypothetical protein [Thermoplasmata archaeon]
MVARDDPPWTGSVQVRSETELERQLLERLDREPRRRAIWVTDLVDPRTAYFHLKAPVLIPPERAAKMDSGREIHAAVEAALAEAAHQEVRVQREGIVGQIDLFDDRPTELKTTGSLVGAEAIQRGRPAYLEQLGLYCALVQRTAGRLLLASTAESPELRVFDTEFSDLAGVWRDATEGAASLRKAIERGTPEGLPSCAWRGRGCPYEDQRVCDCTGGEAPFPYPIAARAGPLTERPEESERLTRRWAERPNLRPTVRRFRDLLYPRRAFFEQTVPAPTSGGPPGPPPPRADDLYRQLSDLLESGPPGEVSRVHPGSTGPESVACFRGQPFLLKVTRAWRTPSPAELLAGQPNYFLELGVRCAALRSADGWLFIGYERADRPLDRLRVYHVRFDPLSAVEGVAESRRKGLEEALASGQPEAATPCPGWMFRNCAYRAQCACGADAVTTGETTGR